MDNSGELVDWLVANSPAEVADKVYVHNLDTNQAYFDNGGDTNGFKCWRGSIQIDFNGAAATMVEQAESQGAKWFWQTTGVVLTTEETTSTVCVDSTDENGVLTSTETEVSPTKVTGVIA